MTITVASHIHLSVTAPTQAQRQRIVSSLGLSTPLMMVDAHRRLRGPYTVAGSVVRALAPQALHRWPELVQDHDVELLTVAPELRTVVTSKRDTLMVTAAAAERTRYYPAAYTARIAHGVTDFVLEHLRRTGETRHTLVIENIQHAEPTDVEFLSIVLRRFDPLLIQLVVCAPSKDAALANALDKYTTQLGEPTKPAEQPDDTSRRTLAARYVATECTSDDPRLCAAYEKLSCVERATLHDERAAELESSGEISLQLGAIPFHAERGHDPVAGAKMVERALEHCISHGFYEAVLDLGRRTLALLDWEAHAERCWLATVKMCTAAAALDWPQEAEELYEEACRQSTLPSIHLHAAYGRAMLYTRFYGEKRDHQRALGWINTAIAIASLSAERERRAYNLTFQENGRALVEMHLGNLRESLRLVDAGLERMRQQTDPQRYAPHRSVLTYNRAQLLARLGDVEEAVDAYTTVIEMDPNHSEYYVERGNLYRRLGHMAEAFDDYNTAIRVSPPYPQSYFNRADLAVECGHLEQAIADFDRVLELDPTLVDAYVNRASAYHQLSEIDAAARDIVAGLALEPNQPHLHCLRGMIAQQEGRNDEAREAFHAALDLDSSLTAAWCNFGVLAFDNADAATAIDCFSRALNLEDDPTVRLNRAIAFQHAGRNQEAIEDYTTVATSGTPDEIEHARRELAKLHGELMTQV